MEDRVSASSRSTPPAATRLAARGIRLALESAFVNGGVDVVFSGHEHIYERAELQHGILYFITGGAGSLRAGRCRTIARRSRAATISDYHFMLAEITDEGFFFQAINRVGVTMDAGVAAPAYCGHDGPSVICADLGLEDAHPFRDRRGMQADHAGWLIEARAPEQIASICVIGQL